MRVGKDGHVVVPRNHTMDHWQSGLDLRSSAILNHGVKALESQLKQTSKRLYSLRACSECSNRTRKRT